MFIWSFEDHPDGYYSGIFGNWRIITTKNIHNMKSPRICDVLIEYAMRFLYVQHVWHFFANIGGQSITDYQLYHWNMHHVVSHAIVLFVKILWDWTKITHFFNKKTQNIPIFALFLTQKVTILEPKRYPVLINYWTL